MMSLPTRIRDHLLLGLATATSLAVHPILLRVARMGLAEYTRWRFGGRMTISLTNTTLIGHFWASSRALEVLETGW